MLDRARDVLRRVAGLDDDAPRKRVTVQYGHECPGCEETISLDQWSEHRFNGCGDPPVIEFFRCDDCYNDYPTEQEAVDCSCMLEAIRAAAADTERLRKELG